MRTAATATGRGARHWGGTTLWTAGLLLGVLAAGVLFAGWVVGQTDIQKRVVLLGQAQRVRDGLSPDRIRALSGTEADLESPVYQRLKAQLGLIREAHGKCRFVYLMGRRPNGLVFFFVDSEPPDSEDYSPPGQSYPEADEVEAGVFAGTPVVEGPASDRWGTWVAAMVPVSDPRTGAVVAVLGMDIEARDWRRDLFRAAAVPGLLTLALATVVLAGGLLLARRQRLGVSAPRWLWRLEPSLTVLVGLALTAAGAWAAREHERGRYSRSFAELAGSETARVGDDFARLRDLDLEHLACFFEASEEVTAAEFEHYTAPLVKDPGVTAWQWVPAVPARDREAFEQGVREAGNPDFGVRELGAGGKLVRAGGREVYYPVLHVAPGAGNEPARGFDAGCEPLRRAALEEAARTGLATATDPLALVQETGQQRAVVVFRPVYRGDGLGRLQGFAVAVVRADAWLAAVPEDVAMHTELGLARPGGTIERLASSCATEGHGDQAVSITRPILAFGKVFQVTARPGPGFAAVYSERAGAWAVLTGSLLTAAVAALVSVLLRRRERLEVLVAERTAQLGAERERLDATLRSMGDGVIETDAQGRVVDLNPAAERLTGWRAAEARGRPLAEVFCAVGADAGEQRESRIERVLRTGAAKEMTGDAAIRALDGTEHRVASDCAPIRGSDGSALGSVLVFRDTTREYRARRLAQLRLSLLDLAASCPQDELVPRALDEIGELLRSPIGFCHFVDREGRMLTLQHWSTRTLKEFCRAEGSGKHYGVDQAGVWADAIRERKPLIHNDYASMPQRKGVPEGHPVVARELVAPVLRDGRVVAVMGVGNKPVDYTADDLEALSYLADVTWQLVEQKRAEQALRESQERYDQLAVQSGTFTWEVDASGLYTYASHVVERVLGYRPEELVGTRRFYDLHPEEGREAFREAAFAVFGRREPFMGLLNAAVTKDGRQVWLSTTGIPRLGADGTLLGYRGNDTDVTARHESERRYQDLFQGMLEGFALHEIVCDADGTPVDYRFLAVNPAFERMTGLKAEAVVGRTVLEVLPGVERHWIRTFGQVALTGEPAHFEEYSSALDKHFEVAAVRPAPRQFACIVSDITERKRMEAERERLLAAAETARRALLSVLDDERRAAAERARLATAIEQTGEAIVITDAQAVIQYVNPAFVKVTGYTRAEAVGRKPSLLKSGQHEAAFYRDLWATIGSGRTWHGRFVNRKKDGTLYTEEATISPVHDAAGRTVNYVAVKSDITEHLRVSAQLQQAQKMEAVGRLAGGVAHDFNNLLMGIMNYTDLCRDALPAEHPVREYLDEITADARRSADLTRQLLAFARKQTIAPKVLDLNDTVAGMLKLLRRLIGEDISLAWLPGTGVWPVKVDPSQVDQVLANLCVNARDAIAGVGRIAIATRNAVLDAAYCAEHLGTTAGEYVLLAVSDTGCGMNAQTLAHLFEPFFTTKPMGHGTGLGLATVYGIVTQNGGHVSVQSEPGKGTTFSLYLPRHLSSAPREARNAARTTASRGGSETILVVEDEKAIRYTIRRFLGALGYTVIDAEAPDVALRQATAQVGPIHLLVTDVVMPGMSGRDLAERLTRERPEMACLYMSGYTADAIVQRGILEEGMHFLPKPFTREELAHKVREVLDGVPRPRAQA